MTCLPPADESFLFYVSYEPQSPENERILNIF